MPIAFLSDVGYVSVGTEVEMSENKGKRDRSPAFPELPLGEALEKLRAFEKTFGRHAAPVDKAGMAWGLKQVGGYLAALRYYGFIEYTGTGDARQIIITEDGRNLLRAQQDSIRQQILKRAALRPKEIAKFWSAWGADRPPDPVCIDELVIRNGFSDRGAPLFLKTYDATIAFAGLAQADKLVPDSATETEESGEPMKPEPDRSPPPKLPTASGRVTVMDGERELTTGLLSKDSSFRLIVSGPIGVREIERLIRKLELDKEILADESEAAPDERT
jgi:hypothetical protein